MHVLRMGVLARPPGTKVVVKTSAGVTVLKALLPWVPAQREALGWLSMALSGWANSPVRAALIADERSTSCDRNAWLDVAQTMTVNADEVRLVTARGVADLDSDLADDMDRPETFDDVSWFLDRWVPR